MSLFTLAGTGPSGPCCRWEKGGKGGGETRGRHGRRAIFNLILYLVLALAFFKGLLFLFRWYEVTGEADFAADTAPGAVLARLVRFVPTWLFECVSAAVVYGVWLGEAPARFVLRGRAAARIPPPASGRPVILIHGFFMTPWSLGHVWWRLRQAGFNHLYFLDYFPMLGGLDGFAGQLDELVERVAGTDGQVDLVAHSQGGLIAARYVGAHPGRVARLVTIGTPFHGTRLWAMSVGDSLPQMRPGSEFLRETVGHPAFPGSTRVTSIYSTLDQIVLPAVSSRLETNGVENVALDGLGHTALLLSSDVAAQVVKALSRDSD
ncbi:MAG: alpha/beta fold hydrolase [Leptospirillia bacterium]